MGQVLEVSKVDLLAIRNFGKKSLYELYDKLVDYGFISATTDENGELAEDAEFEDDLIGAQLTDSEEAEEVGA